MLLGSVWYRLTTRGFFLQDLAWFCDRGLLASSLCNVIILVAVSSEGCTQSVLFHRPEKYDTRYY